MSSETSIREAVILAGGRGTRLRPVVDDVPKPMAPINERPFLEYQLDYLIAQGITRVILSVGYLRHKVEQHFGTQYGALAVEYAVEETPLGTGGGLLQAAALSRLEQPLLVLNGDTWFPVALAEMAEVHRRHHADVTIALREADAAGRYAGIILDNKNRIVKFSSSGEEQSRWINGGVYLISPAVLLKWQADAGKRLSLECDLLEAGIANGMSCYGYASEAPFIDIGVPEDYVRAASVITTD